MGSAFSGGGTSGSQNVYQPTGTAQFDQTYQNLLNSQISSNPYASYAPQAVSTFNQAYNNPYATTYQNAANNAGSAFNTAGTQAQQAGVNQYQSGNTGTAAANQVLNMGFDPQSALYNQTQQQTMDQANAANAAAGVGQSPYGASVANNANNNFNISWQNNALNRAIQGLNGYNSGIAGAGADYTNAANLGTTAAGDFSNAGAAPFNAQQTITSDQAAALQNLMQQLGLSGEQGANQQNLQDLMAYLGLGTAQSDTQAQINQAAQQAAQQGIGSLFSGLTSSSAGNPSLLSQAFSHL